MKKYFLTGLVTLIPLVVTFWAIFFFINFLTKPFMGITTEFLNSFPSFAGYVHVRLSYLISQILSLIVLFVTIFLLGFFARRYFFNSCLKLGDRILSKIPLVNKIYKTSKDIVLSVFNTKKQSFKQVVLLNFPYQGSYCLGMISNSAPTACSTSIGIDMVSVFIPTAPNPMTGYLIMCKKEDLIYLKMKSEDAIKYIVSCAVIHPYPKEKK